MGGRGAKRQWECRGVPVEEIEFGAGGLYSWGEIVFNIFFPRA